MKCEKCHINNASLKCSRCKCGHYCSEKCQLDDWNIHKKFCKLWNKQGKFLNPFYSDQIVKYPPKFDNIDINENFISYSRGYQGETALHFAVINGDINKINSLIDNYIYVNCIDYRNNNALYYACCHPGENNILNDDLSLRFNIVKILIDNGCDFFEQSGFSGKRSFEIAKDNNYNQIYEYIINHKYFDIFKKIRDNLNESSPPNDISIIVKQYLDLYWRSRSIQWLFALGRENMINIKTHPKILEITENIMKKNVQNEKSLIIEEMFLDCQLRHKIMMKNINKIIK